MFHMLTYVCLSVWSYLCLNVLWLYELVIWVMLLFVSMNKTLGIINYIMYCFVIILVDN
jgi:hypothetical protein